MSYKWCAVPKCTNTSLKTPKKLFVSVPKNVEVRRKWLQLSRRDPNDIANSTNIFFCEDHFDMENDMANYYQYKMGFSQKIILKDKILPSKFHCQPDRIKRMCNAGTSRSAFVKRQRMEFVKQCEDIQQPIITNDEPTATEVEACTKELSQKCDKSTLTEPVVTAEKSVQCHFINKVHIRSKAVQTKSLTRDTVSKANITSRQTSHEVRLQACDVIINSTNQESFVSRDKRLKICIFIYRFLNKSIIIFNLR